jgi:hypothetical protein
MLLAGLACDPEFAAAAEESAPAKLFASEATLEVTMTAPWAELETNEDHQGAYPARIEYRDEHGQAVQLDMTVERRGIKRQAACRFPPVKLRFEKEAVKGTAFRGQDSIKMVTHCDKGNRFDQYYVLEMLIYRMYNLLTDYSFRVRPLQVNYVESSDGKAVDNRFAFLIEDDTDVAKRNGLKKLNVQRIDVGQLEPEVSALFSLFQYMIGNVDWAALQGPVSKDECCHNVKLIGPEPLQAGDFAIPVPYDFDSAGLVDAEYAAPPNGLPIGSVTQRLYRGYCLHNVALEAARQQLLAREGDFLALIASEPRLQPGVKKKATAFLEKFFETAKNPKRFQDYVIERCRK